MGNPNENKYMGRYINVGAKDGIKLGLLYTLE